MVDYKENYCDVCDCYDLQRGFTKNDFNSENWYVVQVASLAIGDDDFCICQNCLYDNLNELTITYSEKDKEEFMKPFSKYLEE